MDMKVLLEKIDEKRKEIRYLIHEFSSTENVIRHLAKQNAFCGQTVGIDVLRRRSKELKSQVETYNREIEEIMNVIMEEN